MENEVHDSKKVRGQGLVELVITLPILLLLFLGLIELAMALRAQLVLVNANREATRFGSRGRFTDGQMADRAVTSFSGQLPVQLQGADANTQIIITRFYVPAQNNAEGTYDTPIYVTGTLGHESKIDPEIYVRQLATDNDTFNDDLIGDGDLDAVRTSHDAIVVEIYYHHFQVLRAPLVEWVFPEPMVLYSRTVMRIGSESLSR